MQAASKQVPLMKVFDISKEAVRLRSDRMDFCLALPRSLTVKLLNYVLNCNYQLSPHCMYSVEYFFFLLHRPLVFL